MSRIRFKNLEKLGAQRRGTSYELALPLPRTPNGKVDRECPRESCSPGRFQLGAAPEERQIDPQRQGLFRRLPGTAGTTCPYCGHDAEDAAFTSDADRRAVMEQVKHAAMGDVAEIFGSMLDNAFRGSKVIKVKRTSGPRRPPPRAYREDLLRDVTCDSCSRSYGVFALAFFCPDCGSSNLHVHFARERELVKAQLDALDQQDLGAERRFRSLMNAHEDVISSLESILKAVYIHVIRQRFSEEVAVVKTSKKAIGNRFQNLERGRELFVEVGVDPFSGLTPEAIAELQLALAKRHVIAHNSGIVDQEFVNKTGRGREGHHVTLSTEEIVRTMVVCESIVAHLETTFPELGPPSP